MPERFTFRPAELRAGLDFMDARVIELDSPTGYEPLAEQVVGAMERGESGARDIIPVRMIIDGTLAAMRHPDAWERLPAEISERAYIAREGAAQITRDAVDRDLFFGAFAHIGVRGAMLNDEDRAALRDADYLKKLGGQPFTDSMPALGGAHKVLTRRGVDEPISGILVRSTEMPSELGKIATPSIMKMLRQFGYPYFLPRFLDVIDSGTGLPEVILAEELRAFINHKSNRGEGCPAGRVGNPYGPGTVLTAAWTEMAPVLVPDNATSKDNNRKPKLVD